MIDLQNVDFREIARRGDTEVMATMFARPTLLRALLAHGADAGLTDAQGRTALGLAHAHGRADIAALLQNTTTSG